MRNKKWLIILIPVIITVVIITIAFPQKQNKETVYIDAEPTTADIGVSGDNLVLPADQSFYLQIEDGHVTDVFLVDDTKAEDTE